MNAGKEREASEIEELLPWHAAGTLSRRDAQRVEDALARDPELARRYAAVREEFGENIHLNETLGAPSARAMEKLFARIDAEPVRRQATGGLQMRIAEFFVSLTPRTLAYAGGAAVIAILLQAGFIASVVIKDGGEQTYQSASAPSTAPGVGAFTMIRFAPQATSDDINKFLESNRLSIVAGPTGGGFYRVKVAVTGLPKEELGKVVKRLQENKVVDLIATAN